jgi:hypothetical protein
MNIVTIAFEIPDNVKEWPDELCLGREVAGLKVVALAAYDLFEVHSTAETALARSKDQDSKDTLKEIDRRIIEQVKELRIYSQDF